MSIQNKLKNKVKQILTDRCGRDYERTYCHALERSGYTNTIDAAEEKRLQQWQEELVARHLSVPTLGIVSYDWDQSMDVELILKTTDEEMLVFAENGGRLAEQALEVLKMWAALHPEQKCFYGDEDVLHQDKRVNPWLKPEWSPQFFETMFYVGGVFGVRREALAEAVKLLAQTDDTAQENAIATREPVTAAQLVGLVLLCAGGLEKRGQAEQIGHIPYVLFHHKSEADYEKYKNAWTERENKFRFVKMDRMKKITSVIIPSKDQPEVLERNIRSLVKTTLGLPLEIVVVDNGSAPENREKVEKLLGELTWHQVQYIYEPMEFHFSKMCNLGAEKANGDYLLFLNDDTEAVSEGWIEKMQFCLRNPQVGAVGAKLLYPGTDKIQHAGIVNIPMGPVHKLQFQSDGQNHYFSRNKITANVLAVTGACLMVKAEQFWEVGGFPEELPVAFNDVDLCFSLYEKGYYNVICNDVALYHHESLSRGDDESGEKLARLDRERTKLYQRHPDLKGRDPYYHPYLNHEGLDTRVVAAPEEWLWGGSEEVQVKEISPVAVSEENAGKIRRHRGLFLRIESVGGNFCQGYSFMAGDDNACYEKRLLLEEETGGHSFTAPLGRKLRMDLQENMPDQKNVALCGFSVRLCGLPVGVYRISVLAKNKVTGVTYVNASARKLCIGQKN